jgi:hypothetical protein
VARRLCREHRCSSRHMGGAGCDSGLHAVGGNNSKEELHEMIKEADTTGTGEISINEFVRITNLRAETG